MILNTAGMSFSVSSSPGSDQLTKKCAALINRWWRFIFLKTENMQYHWPMQLQRTEPVTDVTTSHDFLWREVQPVYIIVLYMEQRWRICFFSCRFWWHMMLCLVTVMKRLPGARHQNIAVVFWCYEKANEAAKWPTTVRVTLLDIFKDIWVHLRTFFWCPKPLFFHGKSDHLPLWSWGPKQVFSAKKQFS